MKKILTFMIVLLILATRSPATKAAVTLDLQYSSITAETKTSSIYTAFKGDFREDRVALLTNNEYCQTRDDNIISNYRMYNDIQINYYVKNLYYLVNVRSLLDQALEIDEYSYGIGAGYKKKFWNAQIGLYNRSAVVNRFVLSGKFNIDYPLIIDDIMFSSENTLSQMIEYEKDTSLGTLNAIKVNLTGNLSLKTGLQINYNSADTDSGVNTTKRWFTGANLRF